MMGVDAIIVDPTSGTALDGAIEEATAAGIPVISFNDGPVSSPDAYQILVDCVYNFDYITRWACEKMGGKGDLLLIRGVAGNEYDNQAYQGMMQALADFPEVNVVGEVYGEWNATVAQQEVASILPSLDNVDFVVGQGGDAYGAVQAFQAAGMEYGGPPDHCRPPGQLHQLVGRGVQEERLRDDLRHGHPLVRRRRGLLRH